MGIHLVIPKGIHSVIPNNIKVRHGIQPVIHKKEFKTLFHAHFKQIGN